MEDSLIIYEIHHTGLGESPGERRNSTQPIGWAHSASFQFQKLAFSASPGAQDSSAFPRHFNDPLRSWCVQILQPHLANVQSQRVQRSCAQRNKKKKKIVPWYLDMPRDFLGLCVAVLHRKCVLYFHWSRISGWKLQWIFSEWDVKDFIICFLHRCKETCCLPEKDGRRKVSLPATGI